MTGTRIARRVLLKKILLCFVFLAIAVFCRFSEIFAEDAGKVKVYLKNRDRISGKLIEENEERIVLDHEVFGRLEISRQSIDKISEIKPEEEGEKKKKIWTREISAGYILTRGNTNRGSVSGDLKFNRKTKNSEFTLKTKGYYAASDRKMDAQRYSGMLRYALNFGKSRRWHNFYKFEGDHDRFANIDYRIIHSLGSGFWFSETSDWTAKADFGIGYEHVAYRSGKRDKNETLLIPGTFFEKRLFCASKISQECSFFLPPDEFEEYRMYAESSLINPLNKCLSLKFSIINEYDAAAAEGVKKHDMRFISVLKYDF